MLDRRSQSPIATSHKMGTARAIFDSGSEVEPTKRLTRSIRNTSTEQKQTEQQQINQQYGGTEYIEQNYTNDHLNLHEQTKYQNSEIDTYRTSQVHKPQYVNAKQTSQFNYQSLESKKPETGSFIQTAYINTFQEPQGSVHNYQNKTTYEVPKYEKQFYKYESDQLSKQDNNKPKVYQKFEPYKFEPIKYEQLDRSKDFQSSQRSIVQPNQANIQTSYNPYIQERITLDIQHHRSSSNNIPSEQTSLAKQKINESFQQQQILIQNENKSDQILHKSNYKVPSEREESIIYQYRPTTPVQTQQQQTTIKQNDQLFRQEPIEINFKSSYGEFEKKQEDLFNVVENEANEHEFNAGCQIF